MHECECFVLDVCREKLNIFQGKKNFFLETKRLLCILLQDAFVFWLKKSAYSLGCTFIIGSKFQKFAWTSFLGKVWKEGLVCTPSRNETAGFMGLQVFLQRGCNLSFSFCFFLKLSVWISVVPHPTSQGTIRKKFLISIANKQWTGT